MTLPLFTRNKRLLYQACSPRSGGGGIPGWVLLSGASYAALDIDFVNDRAWNNAALTTISSLLSCSRASTGYYTKADGTLQSFSSNVLRYGTNGLLVEEARTNVVLWNRDLTNAAWTASNCTVAKDQTGNDGTVNGASSLTATAGNATVLQAITLASSARFGTAWVKRITGSGTINMTMDNGSTWTAITATGTWARVSIPTQTLANPTVGFRIVTSGDAIAVDFVQNENGAFATSEIATTSSSATRAADAVTMPVSAIAGFSNAVGTMYGAGKTAGGDNSDNQTLWSLNDGALSNFRRLSYRTSTNSGFNVSQSAGISLTRIADNTSLKAAMRYQSGDNAATFNGAAVSTSADATASTNTTLSVGSLPSSARYWNSYITRLAFWTSGLNDAALQALTT